ncbi:MAG TPA: N-acetyl-gamma-glutamyl-phosphate reductase [Candidatus Omnitrophota bacterium]|nr:N-acetyl-gamma-glutamyl-phosphate reductase [Candidatus Omnitrophota bacterium]HPS36439.1 N-acetyl-gamma-glutamyl-phosphate reductase [Candidatus Omnitrophota bacterium]
MLSCAVLGATGYTGVELTKLLLSHPNVRVSVLTTRQEKPIPLNDVLPGVSKTIGLEITPYSFEEVKKKAEVVFLCLPHTEAMTAGDQFRNAGKVVIDLSADFRLKDPGLYPKWYGVEHVFPERLKEAVYGLCEIHRARIKKADLISNPGCYPTGPSLALIPLLKEKLIDPRSIIINAASGVSGAGKKLVTATHFCEVDGNYNAYKVNKHQHTPEIEQNLSEAAGRDVKITFVPHLLPISRGILATIYAEPAKKVTEAMIRQTLETRYRKEPFVRIKPEGKFPAIKDVQHANFCDIGLSLDARTGRLVILTAIDNLVKGAAGQAVQNMNIRFGFPEEAGLS